VKAVAALGGVLLAGYAHAAQPLSVVVPECMVHGKPGVWTTEAGPYLDPRYERSTGIPVVINSRQYLVVNGGESGAVMHAEPIRRMQQEETMQPDKLQKPLQEILLGPQEMRVLACVAQEET